MAKTIIENLKKLRSEKIRSINKAGRDSIMVGVLFLVCSVVSAMMSLKWVACVFAVISFIMIMLSQILFRLSFGIVVEDSAKQVDLSLKIILRDNVIFQEIKRQVEENNGSRTNTIKSLYEDIESSEIKSIAELYLKDHNIDNIVK